MFIFFRTLLQDPDWQDGWGDDMYINVEDEMRKAKAERAAKKAKQGTRDIIDLTRGNEPLAGKLNRDGSLSIEGSLKGQSAGRAVRGIEDLSRGPGGKGRKSVDVEKEKRESEEFLAVLHQRAEERKSGGRKKRAIPDTGSLWETLEMVVERRKDMALDAVEEELEEEEIMLEQRAKRVAKEFSLIDSVVKGEFEDGTFEDENFDEEEEELEALLRGDGPLEAGEHQNGAVLGAFEVPTAGTLREEPERRIREGEERAEETRRAEESLSMGGFWADLDDEILNGARSIGNSKVEQKPPRGLASQENDVQRSDVGRREVAGLASGTARSAVARETRKTSEILSEQGNASKGQNRIGGGAVLEASNGTETNPQSLDRLPEPSKGAKVAGEPVTRDGAKVPADPVIRNGVEVPGMSVTRDGAEASGEPVTRDGGFNGTVEAPGKQTLLEQLRPARLRRREEPKEETVESVSGLFRSTVEVFQLFIRRHSEQRLLPTSGLELMVIKSSICCVDFEEGRRRRKESRLCSSNVSCASKYKQTTLRCCCGSAAHIHKG